MRPQLDSWHLLPNGNRATYGKDEQESPDQVTLQQLQIPQHHRSWFLNNSDVFLSSLSSAKMSLGSLSDAASIFSRRCCADDVPGISMTLEARCSNHAKATARGVRSSEVAARSNTEDCIGE